MWKSFPAASGFSLLFPYLPECVDMDLLTHTHTHTHWYEIIFHYGVIFVWLLFCDQIFNWVTHRGAHIVRFYLHQQRAVWLSTQFRCVLDSFVFCIRSQRVGKGHDFIVGWVSEPHVVTVCLPNKTSWLVESDDWWTFLGDAFILHQ